MTLRKISNYFIYALLAFKVINDFYPLINHWFSLFNQLFSFIAFIIIIVHKEFILQTKIKLNKTNKIAYLILLFWIIYSLSSCLWATNVNRALMQTIRITNFFLTFFVVTQVIDTKIKLKNLNNLFMIIFFSYIIVSIWEMVTFSHFPTSKAVINNRLSFAPFGPFFNQNNFAAILMIMVPLVIFHLKKTAYKFLIPIIILTLFVIFFVQGARIAILSLSLFTLINLFYSSKSEVYVYLFLVISVFFLMNHYKNNRLFIIAKKSTYSQLTSLNNEMDSFKQTSIKQRKYLAVAAIEMFIESKMFGVGSGNFENYMTLSRRSKTSKILNAHNFFLEILATNGLIIVLILAYLFIYLTFLLLKTSKYDKYAVGLVLCLFFFLPSSLLPSSFFKFNHFWVILGYISSYIVLEKQAIQKHHKIA